MSKEPLMIVRIAPWKKQLFAIVTCGLFFVVVELILWAAGVPTVIEREDPFRGFSGMLSVFQRDGDLYRTRRANGGSSFNDQSFLADKPANGVRIFCLGGSSSYGYPWGAEAAFTSIIGEAVAANHPDLRVEAINASAISYAFHRMNIVADELVAYKPDIFLVFEGHNEFIEPAFFDALKRRSSSRNHLEYWLSHSRAYSGLRFVWEQLKSPRTSVSQNASDDVEGDHTRTFSEAEKKVVIAESRWRLERLVGRAQTAGVRVLLATVPCNLHEWRPEGSMLGGLNEEDHRTWQAAFFNGKKRVNNRDFEGACADLERAARLAPAHAETQFLLGKAYEGLSRWDDARLAYQRACDADAKPIRRLSIVNEIIRTVARQRGALLVDMDRIFEEHSEHGLVGFNLIEDYVHPTREGHELIAWHMWEAMEQAGWFKEKTLAQRALFDNLIAERRKLPVAENPTWIRNQAVILQNQGRFQAAMVKYRECSAKSPDDQVALLNLGGLLNESGKYAEAVGVLERLVAINPKQFSAFNNLGNALLRLGKTDDAIRRYEQAVRIRPDYAQGHANLGFALAQAGRLSEAMSHFDQALRIEPNSELAHNYFGLALVQAGKTQEAIGHYEKALRIRADSADVRFNFAMALVVAGRIQEAIQQFEHALQLNPGNVAAHYNMALALGQTGNLPQAIQHYTEAVRLNPDFVPALNNMAWIRATNADPRLRDGAEAVRLAEHSCQRTDRKITHFLDTLAAAYAEAQRFDEAVATAQEAVVLARSANQTTLADEIFSRIVLYRDHQSYRETPNKPQP